MTRRWETALVAFGLALFGLVALALVFAGAGTYRTLARDEGFAPAIFHVQDRLAGPGRVDRVEDLDALTDLHERWLAYVTGRTGDPPNTGPVVVFTADEYAHMADVRRVFIGFQIAAVAAAAVAAALVVRTARRGRRAALLLARDSSVAAGSGAAVVAIAAALAFDPLFLLFHDVFFPQGNFLFPPDSNLLALYPDEYWYGVTLRIGGSFVVVMAAIALAATATLRQARR